MPLKLSDIQMDATPLGQGSFGVVRKGVIKRTRIQVAVKEMKLGEEAGAVDADYFQNEAKLLSTLTEHTNLYTTELFLSEVSASGKQGYLVLELGKQDLWDFLYQTKGNPLLKESTVQSISFQLCMGLNFLHHRGIYHRDVKPENIMLMDKNLVKLSDFGLAKNAEEGGRNTLNVGTAFYRCPEMCLSVTTYGYAADVWSLGVVFFELCSKQLMITGGQDSDNSDILDVIFFDYTGTPKEAGWPEAEKLASFKAYHKQRKFKRAQSQMDQLDPNVFNKPMLNFMKRCVCLNPSGRATAEKLLDDKFFSSLEVDQLPQHALLKARSRDVTNLADLACGRGGKKGTLLAKSAALQWDLRNLRLAPDQALAAEVAEVADRAALAVKSFDDVRIIAGQYNTPQKNRNKLQMVADIVRVKAQDRNRRLQQGAAAAPLAPPKPRFPGPTSVLTQCIVKGFLERDAVVDGNTIRLLVGTEEADFEVHVTQPALVQTAQGGKAGDSVTACLEVLVFNGEGGRRQCTASLLTIG